MRLTEELFERGKKQKEICSIIDDNYVLLSKTMPCTDADLGDYITTLRKLKADGVNIATVVDFKLIDNTRVEFRNGEISYTKGVFIEERAKGTNFDIDTFTIHTKDDMLAYLEATENYLEEIEKRADASQATYDKLLDDYLKINASGMTADPKPLNFFFDEKEGYTFIDLINTEMNTNQFLVRYLSNACLGFGLPIIYNLNVDNNYRLLSESMYNRYNEALGKIFRMILTSVKKYDIEREYVEPDLEFSEKNLDAKAIIVKDKELDEIINNFNYDNVSTRV